MSCVDQVSLGKEFSFVDIREESSRLNYAYSHIEQVGRPKVVEGIIIASSTIFRNLS